MEGKSGLTGRFRDFKNLDVKDRRQWLKEFLINNSLYIFLLAAIVAIEIYNPVFLSIPSIVNIISLSAANLPIAVRDSGLYYFNGHRPFGRAHRRLVACVSASLLQASGYPNKMFPGLDTMPIFVVFLIAIAIGALVGLINGFCTAKFHLHPFIVTLPPS